MGHSITLALGAVDWVHVPSGLVESGIALAVDPTLTPTTAALRRVIATYEPDESVSVIAAHMHR